MLNKRTIIVCLLVLLNSMASAQITLTQYCNGFTAPSDIRNCGDSRLFVVEQPGRIRIVDSTGTLSPTPFLDITSRVLYGGERGLLGLAFPSDYRDSGYFYVNYTARTTGPTRISRFRVSPTNPNTADPNSEEILLTIYQPYSNHNGGCLAFSPKNGYLYIGTGDGGSAGDPGNRAQNPDSLLGKMLRLAVTSGTSGYQIPPNNIFAGNPSQGREEIWSIGMRNPWRFSFDPITGDLWIGDVGQNAWEEVDFEDASIQQGLNYGWRCYEGNHAYLTTGCAPMSTFAAPVWEYAHTSSNCSVTGGYIYRGGKHADMYGKYFFTDYCVNQMRTLQRTGNSFTHTNLGTLASGSYVTFGTDMWGELYAADAVSGRIMKFSGTTCNPVAAINGGLRDTIDYCGTASVNLFTPKGQGFSYDWSMDGNSIPHPFDTLTVNANGSDATITLTVTDANGCTATDNIQLIYHPLPSIDFTLDSIYCNFDAPENLLPIPPGGSFSGPGVVGTLFDPTQADSGLNVITYTYTDIFGCSASITKTTYIDYCTGLGTAGLLDAVRCYPNPTTGELHLQLPADKQRSVTVRLSSMAGVVVSEESLVIGNGNSLHTMNLGDICDGMYLLNIRYEDGSNRNIRIVLQR